MLEWTHLLEYLSYHMYSIIVALMICTTIVVYNYGASINQKKAEHYYSLILPSIQKHFKNSEQGLVYESPNIIKFYPSDRQSCPFAIISFAFVPRQQIISFCFNWLIFQLKDELVIQIPINNQNPLSLTLAIVQRKNIRTITKKSFPDIKQLCKEYKPTKKEGENQEKKNNVPDTHCILVQKIDHVRYFLDSHRDVETWNKYGKSVKLVYISDVNKFSRYPMAVRMVMGLNNTDVPSMIGWLMSFVDRMSKAKQSVNQRKQALKKRQTLDIKYD